MISQFKLVSIGRAVENKALGSKELEVKLIEHTPFADGEVKSVASEYKAKGEDVNGKAYEVSLIADHAITATWLPWGSNRISAPDIRRGERVAIYQYEDTDQYYWTDLGLDAALRRKETVILAISNISDNNSEDPLSVDNCYFIELSTHNKAITIQTSKSDGEEFLYTFQLNPKEKCVVLEDDDDNHFFMDSENAIVRLHNSSDTYVELNKEHIYNYAKDSINFQAGKTINFQAGNSVNISTPSTNISDKLSVGSDCSIGGNCDVGGSVSASGLNIKSSFTYKGMDIDSYIRLVDDD